MSLSPAELVERCRAEIVGLHEFFVDWFTGELDGGAIEFARFTAATHPSFTMVVPSGQLIDKPQIVRGLNDAHGSWRGRGFRIEILEITDRLVTDSSALVTYEEWQYEGSSLLNARTSSALFVAASHAPNGVVWRHLHETNLGSPR